MKKIAILFISIFLFLAIIIVFYFKSTFQDLTIENEKLFSSNDILRKLNEEQTNFISFLEKTIQENHLLIESYKQNIENLTKKNQSQNLNEIEKKLREGEKESGITYFDAHS